ncbi:MAG: nicotinate phosphoribosyltransferase [Steroidobacteraceae bacterium]
MSGVPVLMTDLYQLTMAQAYFGSGMREPATFELFSRRLPPTRRVLLACGLEQVVEYLESLAFTRAELDYLGTLGLFTADFLDHLARLRFSGSLHALSEGTPFFANEPILRVTAPILEAQLIESRLLNLMHLQTLIASKALRCVLAARGRQLVDFGFRRAHGAEAGLLAARAAYLAGFDATATVEAGRAFGIPLSGTMAHSFIEAHASEPAAFEDFLRWHPGAGTLLIDTYDTARGAERVVELVQRRPAGGSYVQAVRIDSGDLAAEARRVRGILDHGGCGAVRIVLSGNLDEQRIARLLAEGVPADAFGVGTSLDVSADAPALDMAYKLETYAGTPRRKRSPGKVTWPGVKQLWRRRGADGRLVGDTLALVDEVHPGEPLLREIMRGGRRVAALPSLAESREYCRARVAELPEALRTLEEGPAAYPLAISGPLQALVARMDAAGD